MRSAFNSLRQPPVGQKLPNRKHHRHYVEASRDPRVQRRRVVLVVHLVEVLPHRPLLRRLGDGEVVQERQCPYVEEYSHEAELDGAPDAHEQAAESQFRAEDWADGHLGRRREPRMVSLIFVITVTLIRIRSCKGE